MNTKGFVTFFLNIKDNRLSIEDYVELIKKQNKENIDLLIEQGYMIIYVPCFDEACRVEKLNFVN